MKISKQIKLTIWCVLPFVLAIVTAFFKSRIVNTNVDFATGFLSPHGESMLPVLYIAMAASVAICVLLAFALGADVLTPHAKPQGNAYKTILVTSGMLFIAAAAALLFLSSQLSLFTVICGGFLVASGVAQIASIKATTPASIGLCRLFPLFFIGLYLLMFYRLNARNPLIYTYVFEILTIIALLFSLYLCAGTYFEKFRPRLLISGVMVSTYAVAAILALFIFSPLYSRLFVTFGIAECLTSAAVMLLLWSEIFKDFLN